MYANLYVIYLALHILTGKKSTLKPICCIKAIGGEALLSGILGKHPSG
ncbi:MAG: hypothetical protein RLZZ606_303 [Actinomycetota bacterium]|jgi:hypothetical protein